MKKNIKKVFAIILVALMTVSFCACAAQASEVVSQETVKEVQEALNAAGFDCGTPDGSAGNNTKNAISEYQKSKGLTVTGEIDDELLKTLFPPEESEVVSKEETEVENVSTEATTEATAEPATEAKKTEAKYKCTDDDEMVFTFDDGVQYVMKPREGDVLTVDFYQNEEYVGNAAYRPYTNKFVEKFFYAAKAAEDPTIETGEVDVYKKDKDLNDRELQFKWVEGKELLFTFSDDGSTYKMYFEEGVLKVGRVEEEETKELLSFEDEETIHVTEYYVDQSFFETRKLVEMGVFQ